MSKNPVLYKTLVIVMCILFVGMSVIPATAEPLDDDVEIIIWAGFSGATGKPFQEFWDGPLLEKYNWGFGTSTYIINNGSEPVKVHERYEYLTFLGESLRVFEHNHTVQPNSTYGRGDFGYPWRPCILRIIVEAGNAIASKSGISIFNIVILWDN
jgi:hypothetical protein